MTMMTTNSQFGLEDMEALLWGPSSPMVDAMGFLTSRPDQEEQQNGGGTSLEGDTSSLSPLTTSSLSSSSSPAPFYSPPPSPPAVLLQGDKAGLQSDLLSLPWLGHPSQLRPAVSDDTKDVFGDLDWMAERMDLSEFDLDSLIGSCSPNEESPGCPEELLASLDCPMELDSLSIPTLSTPSLSIPPSICLPSIPPPTPPTVSGDRVIAVDAPESCAEEQEGPWVPLCVPEPEQELEIKSEPTSSHPPPPSVDSPSSPAYTLDLGSEVDVTESEAKPVVASVVSQAPRIVLSLSPTRIVLVLAPREEVGIPTVTTASQIVHSSPAPKPSRSRPYPEPTHKASPPSPCASAGKIKPPRDADGNERATSKTPKAKKLKKMAQNKTAATRYRQKKKAEQDTLLDEYSLLERKNMELTEKADSLGREIKYLKELMEEVSQARTKKGLIADP
uniref:Cyclic AMP-dependent transcription factor ATF-4 n=1 Tax=Gasterosteus aculeatus aculeatus TaxID=481459 RepID=A0AAQ4PPA0_GASAC|nr:activating transcription factor 4b [Gasterosteus aculeatus aculeatus]